ncbi:MAG TPA: hypothetical protein VGR47_19425 [Terracidiphilus sp.]|nr:hypothetical protein [Terracidiphilus sp.]
MPSHSHRGPDAHPGHEPEDFKQEEIDASLGYESSDVRISGIIVFLISMGVFVVVTAVLCYGIGSMINAHMNKEDGPTNKWSKTENIRELGNMPSAPAMQDKVAQLMQQFPTPRVQADNGNEDTADLHARENLLLDHYTWIDQSKGAVRIPIERAMQVIAQQGLPVAPASKTAPLMAGDSRPQVTAPLTDGFVPTTFEQEQAAAAVKAGRESGQ